MSLAVLAKATKTVTSHMKEIRVRQSKTPDKHGGKDREIAYPDPSFVIYDSVSDTTYLRGKLLGKGGFAKCYELTDLKTNKVYAGKIISKARIAKPHQRQKILREVELHRDLKHKNVVEFVNFFEDEDNVYIVLENCCRKSLVHVLKHRKSLTETEVKYYVKHLTEGMKYIHSKTIIHRDLKLGNMLLNEQMETKIGDFGLATRIDYEGEKKMTVCGTPNYIAPEVLQKKGHSFEADVWAIGCIMYALLVGRPPFETSSLKETYVRITANTYYLPAGFSRSAKNLIRRCLAPEPEHRPSLNEILVDEFLTSGYIPKVLSSACCTSVPKFPVSSNNPLPRPVSYAVPVSQQDAMRKITTSLHQLKINTKNSAQVEQDDHPDVIIHQSPPFCPETEVELIPIHKPPNRDSGGGDSDRSASPYRDSSPRPHCTGLLLDVLSNCIEHMPKDAIRISTPLASPMLDPNFLWITKWVDYSNKYGFGFQLSNNSIGVLFNDTSRITMGPDGQAIQYYDVSGQLSAYTTTCIPNELQKKTTLLQYFAQYMDEHLIQGGNMDDTGFQDEAWSGGLYLKKWFRTSKAIVLYLSNGTLQVNFFDDHTKIILSYYKSDYMVTFIDEERAARSYCMTQLIQDGCQAKILERMTFAKSMLQNLVEIEGDDI